MSRPSISAVRHSIVVVLAGAIAAGASAQVLETRSARSGAGAPLAIGAVSSARPASAAAFAPALSMTAPSALGGSPAPELPSARAVAPLRAPAAPLASGLAASPAAAAPVAEEAAVDATDAQAPARIPSLSAKAASDSRATSAGPRALLSARAAVLDSGNGRLVFDGAALAAASDGPEERPLAGAAPSALSPAAAPADGKKDLGAVPTPAPEPQYQPEGAVRVFGMAAAFAGLVPTLMGLLAPSGAEFHGGMVTDAARLILLAVGAPLFAFGSRTMRQLSLPRDPKAGRSSAADWAGFVLGMGGIMLSAPLIDSLVGAAPFAPPSGFLPLFAIMGSVPLGVALIEARTFKSKRSAAGTFVFLGSFALGVAGMVAALGAGLGSSGILAAYAAMMVGLFAAFPIGSAISRAVAFASASAARTPSATGTPAASPSLAPLKIGLALSLALAHFSPRFAAIILPCGVVGYALRGRIRSWLDARKPRP